MRKSLPVYLALLLSLFYSCTERPYGKIDIKNFKDYKGKNVIVEGVPGFEINPDYNSSSSNSEGRIFLKHDGRRVFIKRGNRAGFTDGDYDKALLALKREIEDGDNEDISAHGVVSNDSTLSTEYIAIGDTLYPCYR